MHLVTNRFGWIFLWRVTYLLGISKIILKIEVFSVSNFLCFLSWDIIKNMHPYASCTNSHILSTFENLAENMHNSGYESTVTMMHFQLQQQFSWTQNTLHRKGFKDKRKIQTIRSTLQVAPGSVQQQRWNSPEGHHCFTSQKCLCLGFI